MLYRAHLNAPDVSPGISFSVPATQIWPGDELSLAAHREQPVAGIVVRGSPIRLTLAVGRELFECRRWRQTDNLVLKLPVPHSTWTVIAHESA